jgi:hypothetical protein
MVAEHTLWANIYALWVWCSYIRRNDFRCLLSWRLMQKLAHTLCRKCSTSDKSVEGVKLTCPARLLAMKDQQFFMDLEALIKVSMIGDWPSLR